VDGNGSGEVGSQMIVLHEAPTTPTVGTAAAALLVVNGHALFALALFGGVLVYGLCLAAVRSTGD